MQEDNRTLYEKNVQDRSRLRYFVGLLVRWKQNFKYARARRIARKRGAQIGEGVIMPIALAKQLNRNVSIGSHTSIQTCQIDTRSPIRIGNHVIIGSGVNIITTSHDIDSADWEHKNYGIVIDDYVWIATDALILPSCRVVRNTEDMDVVGGNPATFLRKRKLVHRDLVVESLLGGDYVVYQRTWKRKK